MIKKKRRIMRLLVVIAAALLVKSQGYQHTNKPTAENTSSEIISDISVYADDNSWLSSIPEYRGTPYVEVNNDIPFFDETQKKDTSPFEEYAPLDSLGRCGSAFANICWELMPSEERGDISSVTPSGWHQFKLNGSYIMQRCHLIGFQLAGENDNDKNLISGTKYFNVDGMLPFENTVADYIHDNYGNHVLYRVTPIYKSKDDLMAYGVLMEAWSVEDNGYGCQFCVFVYNVQPGVTFDYGTGKTRK